MATYKNDSDFLTFGGNDLQNKALREWATNGSDLTRLAHDLSTLPVYLGTTTVDVDYIRNLCEKDKKIIMRAFDLTGTTCRAQIFHPNLGHDIWIDFYKPKAA